MVTSVMFRLSHDLSRGLFVDIISTKMYCCHGRRHYVTCFRESGNTRVVITLFMTGYDAAYLVETF